MSTSRSVFLLATGFALIPALATVLGAGLGAYWPPATRIRSHVLHFAAGVIFSVVGVELLPEIERRALLGRIVVGFALGVLAMLAVRRLARRFGGEGPVQPGKSPENPIALLFSVGVDFALDGVLIGIGFAAGARIGLLLALAEGVEQFAVGIALAGELMESGRSAWRAIVVISGLAAIVVVSAAAGATALSRLSGGAIETVLSFGVAALLYLVTEELLVEAHEDAEADHATVMFFVGFLLFLVIGMTLG